MFINSALKALGSLLLLMALAALAAGCASKGAGKDNYTSDRDADAVYEMEWNLDPWR